MRHTLHTRRIHGHHNIETVLCRARYATKKQNRPRWKPNRTQQKAQESTSVIENSIHEEEESGKAFDDEFFNSGKRIAHLRASTSHELPVERQEGGEQLQSYLQLPVEQYFITDPELVKRIGKNQFLFELPRLHFFNVWVAPIVEMSVDVVNGQQTIVNIHATKCTVKGSQLIEKLKLNDKLKLQVHTALEEKVQVNDGKEDTHSLKAMSKLDVWCEIVPPFHFIPKRFLEKTCSAVIQSTLTILLKAFLSQLRTDFEYWSTSLEYRQERAERATISTSD